MKQKIQPSTNFYTYHAYRHPTTDNTTLTEQVKQKNSISKISVIQSKNVTVRRSVKSLSAIQSKKKFFFLNTIKKKKPTLTLRR